MMPRVFSSTEVLRIVGVSRQKLDYWARTNLLMPSVRVANGKGTRRLYSEDDLVQLRFVQRLQAQGWSTQKIRKAITYLRTFITGTEEVVLIDGKDTILALYRTQRGEQVLVDTLRPGGQHVLALVLETLVKESQQLVALAAEQGVLNEQRWATVSVYN